MIRVTGGIEHKVQDFIMLFRKELHSKLMSYLSFLVNISGPKLTLGSSNYEKGNCRGGH